MPFTSAPRDCVSLDCFIARNKVLTYLKIGKNFAQMEARVILTELIRNYDFELVEPTLSASKTGRARDERFLAANAGTMSPKNGIHLKVTPRNLS